MNTHEPLGRIRGVIPTSRFAFRLMIDMFLGLFTFRHVPNTVTIYGSARLDAKNKYYKWAKKFGEMLAKNNIAIMTGGGPGIMQAANHGAHSQGKLSYGCHIKLPFEQDQNSYLNLSHETEYFFVRKYILRHSSKAVVAFPGGFGTLDELFECVTLIRTNCAPKMPVILIGKDYWSKLMEFINDTMLEHGTITEIDANQIVVTDDLDEAFSLVKEAFHDE